MNPPQVHKFTRWNWGPDVQRVVLLVVLGGTAVVLGDDGAGGAIELQRKEGAELVRARGAVEVAFPDGERWRCTASLGCSCRIPQGIKRIGWRRAVEYV